MKKCTLNTVAPGTLISYRERHAIVLEHLPQGVFVQLVDPIEDRAFGKTNDWRESDLRQYLNGEFARLLCEGNTDELLDTVTDLTAMDGTTDYGSSMDKVTLLTVDQCRKYRYTRPLPDEWEWTSTPASTPGGWDENKRYAYCLLANGGVSGDYCTGAYGARPAFTLPSSLSVSDDGSVTVNTAPVINYSGGSALGDKTEGFTLNYSVSDADGDAVTVTEKLDNVVQRTFAPALGETQQFQAVLPANFQTILNGDHTITIEATDGKAAAAPVNVTFSKAVHSASITLSTPLAADDMPTAIRLSITGDIPDDAVWTAEVCNNAYDTSPTWENIKPAIQSGYNFVFSNKTKTAENWGINFRIEVTRGPSNTGGYIYAIEGGFQ